MFGSLKNMRGMVCKPCVFLKTNNVFQLAMEQKWVKDNVTRYVIPARTAHSINVVFPVIKVMHGMICREVCTCLKH